MFKFLLKVVLVFAMFPVNALAVCEKPVTYLLESTPSPCAGYLFTPEKELEVRIKVNQYSTLEKLVEKQDELILTMNKRIENQIAQNENLSKQLQNQESSNFWKSAGFFILGAVITGYIAVNVRR